MLISVPFAVESGEKYICRFKGNSLHAITESMPDDVKEAFVKNTKVYEENADKAEKLSVAILEMMKLLSQSIYTVRKRCSRKSAAL